MILNLTDISSEPIHSQISRQLRARILAGSLEEDTELPGIHAFARRHRVSAISVRRAYENLAAEGLLRARPEGVDAGMVVAAVSEDRRRDLAQQRLLETLREQEFSVKELELARDIQCRLLPPPHVDGTGWRVVARNEPARFVAGDFFDVLQESDGSIDVVVADVAGKGIGPSLLMASVKAMLPFLATNRSVTETLELLNERLRRELGRREFVALAMARFQPSTGRLEIANAGLPDPYLLRPGSDGDGAWLATPVEVPGERIPLGLRSGVRYQAVTLDLAPGERLMLVSDGLPEADDGQGEPFGYERFLAHLQAPRKIERAAGSTTEPDSAEGDRTAAWLDTMLDDLRAVTTPLLRDDWTAVVLERTVLERTP